MLYDTHLKVGKVFGIASIPVLTSLGLFPSYENSIPSAILVGTAALISYNAAQWGCGFPDIDSPGSRPAKSNVFLAFLYRLLGINHRGKFSHGLDSVILTFGILYLLVSRGIPLGIKRYLSESTSPEMTTFLKIFDDGGYGLLLIQVAVVSACVGAISHLFADMSTKEGVYLSGIFALLNEITGKKNFLLRLLGRKFRFVPSNFNLFGWKPFDKTFNTGSHYEELYNYVFGTILFPASLAFALATVFFI